MLSIRSGVLTVLLVAVGLLVAVSSAQAKARSAGAVTNIKVTPKRPLATDTVTVSFVAGRISPGQRYEVRISAAGDPSGESGVCTNGYAVRTHGVARRGQRISVTFDPLDRRGWPGTSLLRPVQPRFCPSAGPVIINRIDAEDHRVIAGTRSFRIIKDKAYPVSEPLGIPVKITVLDGSAITVQATGRPDRTFGVGGIVRGEIPGTFQPNSDISVVSMAGDFFLRTFQADAICAGTVSTYLPLPTGGPSNLMLKTSGDGIWTLALAVDPLSLAGCPAPAAPATTTVTLTGHVTPVGLLKLPLSGSVTGVPIATGVTATVTVNLLLNVDLSGKG